MTPGTVAHQVPLSVRFPRQEYWNRLLFPSPGALPKLGIELGFPALAGRFFTTQPPGKLLSLVSGLSCLLFLLAKMSTYRHILEIVQVQLQAAKINRYHSESRELGDFPGPIQVMLMLYCSLLSV